MVLTEIIKSSLVNITLISSISIFLFLIFSAYEKFSGNRLDFLSDLRRFTRKHMLLLAFFVALMATSGSLFYSEILGYTPCKLCWLQRIMMYPLVLILGIALKRKDKYVRRYVIPMALLGAALSAYHYITQRIEYSISCGVSSAVPCTIKYTFNYGFITIPIMALTAFVLIIIIMLIKEN